MVQVIEQTHDEKLKMYMRLPKRELAEMLINCNFILEHHFKQLNKHNIVRVGDNEAVSCQVTTTPNGTDITYAKTLSTPTEMLPAEGADLTVCDGIRG